MSQLDTPLFMVTYNPYYHTEGGQQWFNMTLDKTLPLSDNIRKQIDFLFRPADRKVHGFLDLFTVWKQQLIVMDRNQMKFLCTTPPKLAMRTPPAQDCSVDGTLVVVMASDLRFFHALRNLVASIQLWEPRTRMVVYDLGMEADQVAEAATWVNVELRPFPWCAGLARVLLLEYGALYLWRVQVLLPQDALCNAQDKRVEADRPLSDARRVRLRALPRRGHGDPCAAD
jgi:hypothetical protein